MKSSFKDVLDLTELLWVAASRGSAAVSRIAKNSAERLRIALRTLFSWFAAATLIPVALVALGMFTGGQTFFVYAGLGFGVLAVVSTAALAAVPIVMVSVFGEGGEGTRRILRLVSSTMTSLLCVCLILAVVPWDRNPGLIPIVLLSAAILGISNSWLLSPRLATTVATLFLLVALTGITFPSILDGMTYRVEEWVAERFDTPPMQVRLTCEEILSGSVIFFSGGEARYSAHRSDSGQIEVFSRGGVHPQLNTPLHPILAEDVEALVAACETEQQQAALAQAAAIRARDSIATVEVAERARAAEERRLALEAAALAEEEARIQRLEDQRMREASEREAARETERRAAAVADSISREASARFDRATSDGFERMVTTRNPVWERELASKNVRIYYSPNSAEMAGSFAGVAQALGARVSAIQGRPDPPVTEFFEIFYHPTDLSAATALQAATAATRRLSITSDPALLFMAIWFP